MIPLELDINNVSVSNGDYAVGEIGNALEPYLNQIALEMCNYCKNRKTVVFLPLVKTSQRFTELLNVHGLRAVEVNGNSKRVVKMPLLHFLDTGLAAYLLRWSSPETLEKGLMSGAFFETFVFSEIYKSYIKAGKEPPIYYYRDRDQKEIDLLLFQDGIINPIEIKKSVSPGRNAIKNFGVLDPIEKTFSGLESLRVHIGTGAVVCLAEDVLPIDQNNYYVPAWLI